MLTNALQARGAATESLIVNISHELRKMLYAWKEQADKLSSEEISKDKYDEWRYHYPEFDTTQIWAKVPSQALSDALV